MYNDIKGGLKGVLNAIPIILLLGVILGFGSYTTLFGAAILSFLALFVNRGLPFIYLPTVVFVIFLAAANVFLGGRDDTLFAMLFLTSLITIFIAIFNVHKKTILNIPKEVSFGFAAGAMMAAFMLSFPLIVGHKTFSSVFVMFQSNYNCFLNISENALVCAFSTLAAYYFLSKIKSKYIPASFLALIFGCLVSFSYKMGLTNVLDGFTSKAMATKADFGDFYHLLLFSILASFVLIAQTLSNLKSAKNTAKPKKTLFLVGIANLISSMTGAISGTISSTFANDCVSGKLKTSVVTSFEVIILSIFILSFTHIAPYIPISAVSMVFMIKMYEAIRNIFHLYKNRPLKTKSIFFVCFLTSSYNIILGMILASFLTLLIKRQRKV